MWKLIKWGALAVVLLVVVAVVIVYVRLNSIVEYVVESQGTQQMNLATLLDGADVGLVGGEVELDGLTIANPPGFTAEHLFSMDEVEVKAPFKQLRGNPKRISRITLDEPKLVVERSADGKFNFKAAIDQMPKSPTPSEPQKPAEPAGEEVKVVIDELTVKDATVVVRHGLKLPGLAPEITVTVPTVVMKNIGNDESARNGAAIRDVAQQVITVLAANASNSTALPAELRELMNLDVKALQAELGKRLGAEAQKRVAAAVPGELGKQLGELVADPNALMNDPNEALEAARGKAEDAARDAVSKELEKRGLPATLPTNVDDIKKDPAKAVEGLKGLLGGKKQKSKDKSAEAGE